MPDRQPEFRIGSFCQDGGCVSVAVGETKVLVRDSKNPNSPVIPVGASAWRAFLHSLDSGEAHRAG